MILIKPHSRLCISPFIHSSVVSTRSGVRSLDRTYTSICPTKFAELATNPAIKRQIYISRSTDPFLNLSIEHFLLQKTPAESTILFLYTNRPCVVIGRNQNPWVEVNLQLLDATQSQAKQGRGSSSIGDVLLVRRRSGGGTVFHDEGNVNYSVICPTPDFNRDKHAEMVVRALRDLGIARARVNDRHDIVLDQGPRLHDDRQPDAHRTAYMTDVIKDSKPLKISGSAYKLTRLRSLHHGTCLLSSPYLNIIPHYLHSPAKPYIKARGVDSVSSPIGNVGVGNVDFERSVIDQFATMYGLENNLHSAAMMSAAFQLGAGWVAGVVGNAHSEVPDICKGLLELRVSRQVTT